MFVKTHFRLRELPSGIQDRLVCKWQERAWDAFDSDNLTDWFRQELEPLGYPTDKIRWSLSYCQGDGMAFYGPVDLKVVFERLVPQDHPIRLRIMLYGDLDPFDYLTCELTGDWGHYHHWNSMTVNLGWSDDGTLDEADEEFLQEIFRVLDPLIESDVQKTSRQLEEYGYNEIEHVSGSEAAHEALAENWYNEYGDETDPPDMLPLASIRRIHATKILPLLRGARRRQARAAG